ncbi:hypothetical protein DH2020_007950 [Rehmannia glutinosa]|uniref:L-ascorbate oxidase n=1 Tax=Rehmannia glutinosa TaxID=99300 RepID=A0ABR0U046_REHGL
MPLRLAALFVFFAIVAAEDPYRFFTWNVTYGTIWPLGPDIYSVTNDNIIVNVFNSLDQPFLIHWNGIQNRRNSYEDGVYGTTCPIPPGKNFTYILQMKDQIGSFFYFPSLAFHKAAGGFGGIRILSRPLIPVPFDNPTDDFTVLIGDWYTANHTDLKAILDRGNKLPFPDGILINGRGPNVTSFTLQQADQQPQDYYIVASSRFTTPVLTTTGFLRYANANRPASGPLPGGPTTEIDWSLNQARSIRTNLTASGPRPNPQGSYHYGMINTTRTIRLSSSAGQVANKQRYALNSVSFVPADTPLKVADYFKIDGVFRVGSISDAPTGGGIYLDTSVLGPTTERSSKLFLKIRKISMDGGQWSSGSRSQYNLRDAVSRCTVQVYPNSWTAIYVALDNVGMWNLRSEFWARQYLGQQTYLRVYTTSTSLRDEYPIPKNALLCGRASGRRTRPL